MRTIKSLLIVLVFLLLLLTAALAVAEPASPGQTTPTPTPESIAAELAEKVSCNQQVGGNNADWPANVTTYPSCRSHWIESGPEAIYQLTISDTLTLNAELFYDDKSADLDLFLLLNPKASSCIASGDRSIDFNALAAGSYYLVVDGYQGSTGPFTVQITCRALQNNRNFWPLTMHP